MRKSEFVDRPNCPRSSAYAIAFCRVPTCGLHLIGFDQRGDAQLEIVLTKDQTQHLLETCTVALDLLKS